MMSRLGEIPGRLYRGEVSINIVSRQKMWYAISGLILVVSVIALVFRGLNFSVEFKGGSVFEFPAASTSQSAISRVVTSAGGGTSTVQYLSGPGQWQVQTAQLATSVSDKVQSALQSAFNVPAGKMDVTFVGPTWGSEITSKALEALIIFLVVIVIYLSVAFEWRMAIGAFVALLHDILITVGVYALVGLEVSPTTIIGLLTILGYSLYDTVVVFDKVRENTAGLLASGRSTYSQAANLALNQTLVRSINTSLTALIPVASILFIGGALLGAGTLNDLSLVLFIGMLSGTYSSLCIATPVLADLKERDPAYKALAKRVTLRESGGRAARRAAARAQAGSARARAGAASTAAGSAPAGSMPVREEPAAAAVVDGTPEAGRVAEPAAGDEVTVPPSAGSSLTDTARPAADAPRRTTVRQQQPRRTQQRQGARKKRR